jgi:hypothetical protein
MPTSISSVVAREAIGAKVTVEQFDKFTDLSPLILAG